MSSGLARVRPSLRPPEPAARGVDLISQFFLQLFRRRFHR